MRGFILHCTLDSSKRLHFNQQNFLFVISPASGFVLFLMGVNVKNTVNGESRPLTPIEIEKVQIEKVLRDVRNRLQDDGKMEGFDDGADPFSANFHRCKNTGECNCSHE